MPIYAYRCEECGFAKDVLQKISDAPLTDCPSCGKHHLRNKSLPLAFSSKVRAGMSRISVAVPAVPLQPAARRRLPVRLLNLLAVLRPVQQAAATRHQRLIVVRQCNN
jgi:putative FmdB family regulatory protein